MAADAAHPARPRGGRPRAAQRSPAANATEDILRVAGELFARQGFAATTTREIAAGAGLRQPTLFHYFPTKHAILRAIIDRALAAPSEALEAVLAADGDAGTRLYALLWYHCLHLASEPVNLKVTINETYALPRDEYRDVFTALDGYTSGLRRLVRTGIADGELIDVDDTAATMAILGMANWILQWFRPGELSPRQVADATTDYAVRGLLARPSRLGHVRRSAHRLLDRLGLQGGDS